MEKMLFSSTVYQTSSVLHNTTLTETWCVKICTLFNRERTLIHLVSNIRKCTLPNGWQPC